MLSLKDLLFSMPGDEAVGDHTAMALKAPDPDERRRRIAESTHLGRFADHLAVPPRGELIEAFDCAWSKQRTDQANDELYLTVSQVQVKEDRVESWREYGSYLGWCADAACSNLFFPAASRLYHDASLNLFKLLRDLPQEELESALRALSSQDTMQPLVEALDGNRLVAGRLYYRGRPQQEEAKRAVMDRLDAFVEAVKAWNDGGGALHPLVESLVDLFKGAAVAVFDPDRKRDWRKALFELNRRLQSAFDWLRRRSPDFASRLAEARHRRNLRHARRELKRLQEIGHGKELLDLDRQSLLERIEEHFSRGTGDDLDTVDGVERAREELLEACAEDWDETVPLLLALLDMVDASLRPHHLDAHRRDVEALIDELRSLRASLSGQAREEYRRNFVPFPIEQGRLYDSLAGWEGTPRLRRFLLGMGDGGEAERTTELDALLAEAHDEQELPSSFYIALSNILGKKGFPGLAALANYHLALRQIEEGQVGTALGSLGLCFGLLEQANKLSFDSIWYRWTYEIACHAATKMQSLGDGHSQGTSMLKEIALLALRDLQRNHEGTSQARSSLRPSATSE